MHIWKRVCIFTPLKDCFMERYDFEIALLQIDAVAEDIENKKQEAEKFNNYISSLIDENGPNFDPSFSGLAYKLLTTDSRAQLLVAFEYFKHGRPARWFEAEDKA